MTNQVDIASYSQKKFVAPFVDAVKALYLVSTNENLRILEFKRFINEFGTHYASTSEMGTKLSIERRYSTASPRIVWKIALEKNFTMYNIQMQNLY